MLDRKEAPSFEEIKKISLAEPNHYYLDNGISVFGIQADTQPVVRVEFIFQAGKWFEEKKGISFFTCKMLAEGTKHRSSSNIANEIDRYGAFLKTKS